MRSTFRLSFALKNTYRVNGILYSLKQIPLLRRLLPQALYRSRGLKRFAGLLAAVWELLTAFLGKLLYMLTMVTGVGVLYENAARGTVFLHILLCLTVIGGFMNTGLFNPTRDKYYANDSDADGRAFLYAGQLCVYAGEGDRRLSAVYAFLRVGERRSALAVPCAALFYCGLQADGGGFDAALV